MDNLEFPSGRAPFILDEDFKPLRTPNSHPTANLHNNFQQLQIHSPQGASPKLSPFAREFVPQGRNTSAYGSGNNDIFGQQQLQLEQQQQLQLEQQQQPQTQYQSYSNGYQQPPQQNHYHLQQQQQIHQQQQQQQHIYQQQQLQQQQQQQQQQMMQMSTKSVQDRLNPTLYSQHVQQQQHSLHQQRQQLAQHYQRENNQARYQHHHQQHAQQHHQNYHEHGHSNASKSPNESESSQSSEEAIALDYLKTVMQCLNQNPGQYDTVATRFLNVFEGMENNEYVLANAMEDIFEESIQNSNFRYMGAKLYNLLHMLNPKQDSFFNVLLKCKLDYHQQQVVEYLKTNQTKKVHETALFLAELYMQLSVGGDEQQRIQLIADNIIYSLKQLLTATLSDNLPAKEASDNVRCICMTLKLAGYDLTTDCGADIAQIIAQLEAINAQAPGKYPMAANVISLQKNNWGRKQSSSSFNSSNDDEYNGASGEPSRQGEILRVSDEPIFYGPDGRELTAEEAEFLANGMAPDSATDDDDDPSAADLDVEYDLEMDEETEKDYKEFCKLKHK